MNSLKNTESASTSTYITKLYVRYMVSLRCKMTVKAELEKLELNHTISITGALEFPDGISSKQKFQLKKNLRKSGLDLLDDSESLLIDKIITTIVEFIHETETLPKISYKEIIHDNLGSGGESILKIFSEVKGVSVTQFIINQKIDRAKELLLYDEFTLDEITEKLNYRNRNFFVSQFKKFTGLSPSYYSELKDKRNQNIGNNKKK